MSVSAEFQPGDVAGVEHNTSLEEIERRNKVVESLDPFVLSVVAPRFLLAPDKLWKPGILVPRDAETARKIEAESRILPRGTLVAVGGNLITEKALPPYQTTINRPDSIRDRTGADQGGWATWSRGWTAEEARHGDVLEDYLGGAYGFNLDGMRETTYELVRKGFDPHTEVDPYKILIYATMQERATQISHNNTAAQVDPKKAPIFDKMCKKIASDEGRHFNAYRTVCERIATIDPDGFINAFHTLAIQDKMGMPGRAMDGFDVFAAVGQLSGMYTAGDYVDIVGQLTRSWNLQDMTGLSPTAEQQRKKLMRFQNINKERVNNLANIEANKVMTDEYGNTLSIEVPWLNEPFTIADVAVVA